MRSREANVPFTLQKYLLSKYWPGGGPDSSICRCHHGNDTCCIVFDCWCTANFKNCVCRYALAPRRSISSRSLDRCRRYSRKSLRFLFRRSRRRNVEDRKCRSHLETDQRRTNESITVQVVRLQDLLAEHHVSKDFAVLSVDTEGMDYEVLQGLNLSIFRPKVIITEDYAPKDMAKYKMLEEAGYLLLRKCNANSVWRNIR